MNINAIAPRSDAMVELVALVTRENDARARVDEISREARAATQEAADAREALIQLERGAGGGGVTTIARRKAEARLVIAEERVAERWREGRAGAERAAMDARHAIQMHAAKTGTSSSPNSRRTAAPPRTKSTTQASSSSVRSTGAPR